MLSLFLLWPSLQQWHFLQICCLFLPLPRGIKRPAAAAGAGGGLSSILGKIGKKQKMGTLVSCLSLASAVGCSLHTYRDIPMYSFAHIQKYTHVLCLCLFALVYLHASWCVCVCVLVLMRFLIIIIDCFCTELDQTCCTSHYISACWVILALPYSIRHMDYRIFNVCMWSLTFLACIYIDIYTHGGPQFTVSSEGFCRVCVEFGSRDVLGHST